MSSLSSQTQTSTATPRPSNHGLASSAVLPPLATDAFSFPSISASSLTEIPVLFSTTAASATWPSAWPSANPVSRRLFPTNYLDLVAPSTPRQPYGGPTFVGSGAGFLPPLSMVSSQVGPSFGVFNSSSPLHSDGVRSSMPPPGFLPFRPSLSVLSSNLVNSAPNVKNIVTTELRTVEDYLSWRTQFESFLVSHSLLGIVDGSIRVPSFYIYDNNRTETINPEYCHWLKIDQTVRSWIFATLSRDTLVEVHDVRFSADIWQRLQNRFMSASLARSMELKRSLSNVAKQESYSMDQYLREIKMIADSLAAINSPVSTEDLIQHVVLGLGPEYESLVTAITHFPGPITFDDLHAKLLAQEQRVKFLRDHDNRLATHQAFATNTSLLDLRHPLVLPKKTIIMVVGAVIIIIIKIILVAATIPTTLTMAGDGVGVVVEVRVVVVTPISKTALKISMLHLPPSQMSAPAMTDLLTGEQNDAVWYPDSGASSHMTNNEGSHHGGGASTRY